MDVFMSPDAVTERPYLFVARYTGTDRASQGGGLEAGGEDIDVLELRIDDGIAMIADGRIRDGKTIILLQYAALHLFAAAAAP